MPEAVSKDIRACECGKIVAWLPSSTGRLLSYDIKRDILTEPDGTRAVMVSTEDIHYCRQYLALAGFVRNAIERGDAKEIRIRLPAAEPFVLSWRQGKATVSVSNGKAGKSLRSYGSINLRTGGYRLRRQSDSLKDLLDQIDENPFGYDWSGGGSQTSCCYCGRPLNDPRSVRWGYGRTCAAKFGLPWW
jgi:Family of unknown function (DUF6011)